MRILKEYLKYQRKASRIELFIRIIYLIPILLIIHVYTILAGICHLIQWFIILIFGFRNKYLSKFVQGYVKYIISLLAYAHNLSDERPKILPEPYRIFFEKEE